MNDFTSTFSGCKNEVEIKKLYKKLAKENHPDLGGSNEAMKALNSAYEMALKNMDGQENDGRTYRYNETTEKAAAEMLQKIFAAGIRPEIKVALMGTWIWVTGTQKEDKDIFNKNGLGLFWSRDKSAWYWKPEGYRSRSRGDYSIDDIADKYGEQIFKQKARKAVAA